MKPARLALLLFVALPGGVPAQEDARPPLTVFFADGSSQPLRAWSLDYEYATWPKGDSPARGSLARRASDALLVGKKAFPTAGLVLELQYEGASARGLVLTGRDGRRSSLKADPPAAERVAPALGKDMLVQVRALDLQGETLTGGRRSYCLLSYTVLVECAAEPSQRVVKVRFP
jgi:hypothetical protein